MKRAGLLKRSKALQADPEKARAFAQRRRQRLAQRAEKRGEPPPLPPVRFRARRPARDQWCARCAERGRRRRADCHHHWLPQQHIRVYVRGLRLSEQTARALLRKLLRDERNLVALCDDCHEAHESPGVTSRRLSGEEVPYDARVFALELGPEWAAKLTRLYPGGQRA